MLSQNNIYDPVDVDQDYFLDHEAEREEFYSKAMAMPGSIIGILFDTETSVKMKEVSESLQLNQNQSAELSRLIRKILIAEVYLGNIVSEITNKLSIGQDVAREIANRLITQLFAPALEDIKKIHVEKFGQKTATPSLPVAPKPYAFVKAMADKEEKINPNNILDLRK